jgi:hypothetical protein
VNRQLPLFFLLFAALLEVGGDAIIRKGLHSHYWPGKFGLILTGGLVLLGYGIFVNLPDWDFGRLLGVYVTLFFLVAQVINYTSFGKTPSLPIFLGGLMIMGGGILITVWKS